jgi:outer membrane biosynthesis protein TonB
MRFPLFPFVVCFSAILVISCGTDNSNTQEPVTEFNSGAADEQLELGKQSGFKAKGGQRSASNQKGKSKKQEDEDDEENDCDDESAGGGGANTQPPVTQPPTPPKPQPPAPQPPAPQPPAPQPPAPQPPAPQPPAPQPPAPQPPAPQPPVDPLAKLQADYNGGIKAIIDTKCQTCHVGRQSNMKDFASVKQWSSAAASEVSKGSMPIGAALPAADKTSLLNFLNALKVLP